MGFDGIVGHQPLQWIHSGHTHIHTHTHIPPPKPRWPMVSQKCQVDPEYPHII